MKRELTAPKTPENNETTKIAVRKREISNKRFAGQTAVGVEATTCRQATLEREGACKFPNDPHPNRMLLAAIMGAARDRPASMPFHHLERHILGQLEQRPRHGYTMERARGFLASEQGQAFMAYAYCLDSWHRFRPIVDYCRGVRIRESLEDRVGRDGDDGLGCMLCHGEIGPSPAAFLPCGHRVCCRKCRDDVYRLIKARCPKCCQRIFQYAIRVKNSQM